MMINFVKTALTATCATLLLSSGLAMAGNTPKAMIEKNSHSKTLTGASTNSTQSKRGKTWHFGEVNDNVIFSSNISIVNRSGSIVYSTIDFYGMNIHDTDYLIHNDVIDNITTNFQFVAAHLTLSDSHHDVFFDGNVYPNTHFTIKAINTYINLGARSTEGNAKLELVRD
jgi:hypothetical protein